MKKSRICLALLLAILLCGSALAASRVFYEGGAEEFVFLPGSSGSDLFENFKNVMPGDALTQEITVCNDCDTRTRIYMRAEPIYESDRAFLEKLHLKVEARNDTVFDAAADQTDGLTGNRLLGTFKTGGSTTLKVTLTVPADLGNEFMNASGIVPWTFLAEELEGGGGGGGGTPKTGDWYRAGIWSGAALLLLAAIALVLVRRRRAG
ncbi:MAG: LPXTG cell wall anchor domain-containing protein [Candidatus Excrementavichristensenella sp.]|jgi:LPXTG-motif cell wall-anchored protein